MVQTARPASDITTTNWSVTPLWSKVNDASDTSTIRNANGATDSAEVKLGSLTDPVSSTGHTYTIRCYATGSSAGEKLTASLVQGTTVIATGISGQTIARTLANIADYSYTLSAAEADAISDYTDLRLRFNMSTGGAAEFLTVADVWLQVPDFVQNADVTLTTVARSATTSTPTENTENYLNLTAVQRSATIGGVAASVDAPPITLVTVTATATAYVPDITAESGGTPVAIDLTTVTATATTYGSTPAAAGLDEIGRYSGSVVDEIGDRVFTTVSETGVRVFAGAAAWSIASVTEGGPNAEITLSTVSASGTVWTLTEQADANLTLTTVTATATVNTPTVAAEVGVTLVAVQRTTATNAPSTAAEARAPPQTVAALAAVNTPTVAAWAELTSTAVARAATGNTPGVTGDAQVSLVTATVTAAAYVPDVQAGENVPANVPLTTVERSASTYTPTVAAEAQVTLTGVARAATATAPSVTADASVTLAAVQRTAAANAPTAAAWAELILTALTRAATTNTPSLTGDANVTLTTVVVTTSVPLPGIEAGGAINVSLVTVTAAATVPTITAAILQLARPSADVTDGGWTNELGSNVDLYASLDEFIPSDDDYCKSTVAPSTDLMEVSLSGLLDPQSSSDHVLHYRYGKTAANERIDVVVRLVQGTTVIATWTHTDVLQGFTTATQTLTAEQADAITNYADLRVRVEATQV